MTGLACCNLAKDIALPSCSFSTMKLQRIQELQVLKFENIRASVINMHKFMLSTCARLNDRRGFKMTQFSTVLCFVHQSLEDEA